MATQDPAAEQDPELKQLEAEVAEYFKGTRHGRADALEDADVLLARAEEKCAQGGELRLADVQALRTAVAALR